MADFFSGDTLDQLKNEAKKRCNGFLILFDIKDSTARKREYKDRWVAQTGALYDAFTAMCVDVSRELSLELLNIKFRGDGLMAFFKSSDASRKAADERAPSEASLSLLRSALEFRSEVHIGRADELGDMRLKTVLTYLTGIYPVSIKGDGDSGHGQGYDVLGRGIDFAHRLETFGDASHIVVNDWLYESLPMVEESVEVIWQEHNRLRLDGIRCKKRIKGWEQPEPFWLLTDQNMIRETIEYLPASPYENDVRAELFRYYIAKSDQIGASEAPLEADNVRKKWGKGHE